MEGPNGTLFISAIIFLFTLWGLNRLLFQPLFEVLDERRSKTSDLRLKALRTLEQQEALFEEYSGRLRAEKQAGYRLAEQARSEALRMRQERIAQARLEASRVLEEAKEQLQREMEEAKRGLREQVREVADLIVARLLQRSEGL